MVIFCAIERIYIFKKRFVYEGQIMLAKKDQILKYYLFGYFLLNFINKTLFKNANPLKNAKYDHDISKLPNLKFIKIHLFF